nr:hypothetical protein [uncultured organism]
MQRQSQAAGRRSLRRQRHQLLVASGVLVLILRGNNQPQLIAASHPADGCQEDAVLAVLCDLEPEAGKQFALMNGDGQLIFREIDALCSELGRPIKQRPAGGQGKGNSNDRECRADRLKEIYNARLNAEQAERDRNERLRQERVSRLLDEAEAFRKAETIRAYVAVARDRASDQEERAIAAWADWALDVAASIDPVASGAFLLKPSAD